MPGWQDSVVFCVVQELIKCTHCRKSPIQLKVWIKEKEPSNVDQKIKNEVGTERCFLNGEQRVVISFSCQASTKMILNKKKIYKQSVAMWPTNCVACIYNVSN